MYQVVIVEDNPMIAMLNRRNTEKDKRFEVTREFADGRAALRYLLGHPVDLVILDVYMPLLTGVELLGELRRNDVHVDVVMVTAANDPQTFDLIRKLGVVDYLVKPFTYQRFQQALDKFCQQRETLSRPGTVSQADIDRLLFAPAAPAGAGVTKGLQEKTLEMIREHLADTPAGGCTSEEIAVQVGLSAVTVRRYLNFMTDGGVAESHINYDTGGRPCTLYRLAQEKA